MASVKTKFNCNQSLKLTLVGVGWLLSLNTPVVALELNAIASSSNLALQNTAELRQQPTSANFINLAQIGSYTCPPNNYLYRYAETRNHVVQICATEGGNLTYFLGSKDGTRDNITLPTRSNSGQQFVAVNGNIRYLLNRKLLRITQDDKIIVRETVLRWFEGRGIRD
jgi:hypothetical protein